MTGRSRRRRRRDGRSGGGHRRHHQPRAGPRIRRRGRAARRPRAARGSDGRAGQPRPLSAFDPARAALAASLRIVPGQRAAAATWRRTATIRPPAAASVPVPRRPSSPTWSPAGWRSTGPARSSSATIPQKPAAGPRCCVPASGSASSSAASTRVPAAGWTRCTDRARKGRTPDPGSSGASLHTMAFTVDGDRAAWCRRAGRRS